MPKDKYAEGKDADGNPVLIRDSDGHEIVVDPENTEFCKVISGLETIDDTLPRWLDTVPAMCRFYSTEMKEELLDFIQFNGYLLSVRFPKSQLQKHRLHVENLQHKISKCVFRVLQFCWESEDDTKGDGLEPVYSRSAVSLNLLQELNDDLAKRDEKGQYTRTRLLSSWPVRKAFVYFDISDFSRFPSGQQALVINFLTLLTNNPFGSSAK